MAPRFRAQPVSGANGVASAHPTASVRSAPPNGRGPRNGANGASAAETPPVSTQDGQSDVEPDFGAARKALRRLVPFRGSKRFHIAAIPREGGSPIGHYVDVSDDAAWTPAAEWLDARQAERCNVYFTPNVVREGCRKAKPNANDIERVAFVYVDLDPVNGDREALHTEVDARKMLEVDPAPTLDIDSGNGRQLIWALDGEFDKAEAAAHCARFDGGPIKSDQIQNPDRLLRLPGTVNFPNERKRTSGLKGGLARVVEATDTVISSAAAVRGLRGARDAGRDGANVVPLSVQAMAAVQPPERPATAGATKVDRAHEIERTLKGGGEPDAARIEAALLTAEGERLVDVLELPVPDDRSPTLRSAAFHAIRCGLTIFDLRAVLDLWPESAAAQHLAAQARLRGRHPANVELRKALRNSGAKTKNPRYQDGLPKRPSAFS